MDFGRAVIALRHSAASMLPSSNRCSYRRHLFFSIKTEVVPSTHSRHCAELAAIVQDHAATYVSTSTLLEKSFGFGKVDNQEEASAPSLCSSDG